MYEYFLWDIIIFIAAYLKREKKKVDEAMEKEYGRRRLFVRQGGILIYSRRLLPEQTKLIDTAIKSLGLSISMDDSTVCPILLGCVSSSVSPDGRRNQTKNNLVYIKGT